MNRSWQRIGLVVAALAFVAWTLTAVAAWWGLNASAHWLSGQSAASAVQWVTQWTERPWVQYWIDPHDIVALRDAVDWVLHLGGGPQSWVSTVVWALKVLLVMTWAGGVVLAMVSAWVAQRVAQWAVRRFAAWWRAGPQWPWQTRGAAPSHPVSPADFSS